MFVPRSVKRSVKSKPTTRPAVSVRPDPPRFPTTATTTTATAKATATEPSSTTSTGQLETGGNEEYEEIASVMEWVLSDECLRVDPKEMGFAKWIDRHRGYLPINQILSHPSFEHLSIPQPLNPHALSLGLRHRRILHGRLNLVEPKMFGSAKSRSDTEGGLWIGRVDYQPGEFRRKLETWNAHAVGTLDELELYIENIPPGQKTYTQVLSFVNTLFTPLSISEEESFRVASLSYPPKARGYAFVCLPSRQDRDRVLDEWSWEGARERASEKGKGKERLGERTFDSLQKEAKLAGLRCLPRTEYNRLEKEYSEYLVSRTNALGAERKSRKNVRPDHSVESEWTTGGPGAGDGTEEKSLKLALKPEGKTKTETRLDYPEGCLLFVRRLNPDTSKTTIKDLFGAILRVSREEACMEGEEQDQDREIVGTVQDELGYIDWIKGRDSCHIRVAHPSISNRIASYLSSRPIFHLPLSTSLNQTDGLPLPSATMVRPVTDSEPIDVEVVRGERERIYWMGNVKESVRAEAVRLVTGSRSDGVGSECEKRKQPEPTDIVRGQGKKPRCVR